MRVVIAEDEALLREGLRALLTKGGLDVVAVAVDAEELVALAASTPPDLVITDIRMPPGHGDDGLRAALAIRNARPGTPVMVLSQYVQRQYAVELLADGAGGVGYLLKQRVADVETFRNDVVRVAGGETVLDPDVVEVMMSRAHVANRAIDRMTARQREVMALIAEGRSNAAIAAHLHVSEKAVVQHSSRIYTVLDLPVGINDHRRVLAVLQYLNR